MAEEKLEENTLYYFSISGFNIIFYGGKPPLTLEELSNNTVSNWKYLMLARRIISYSIVFKAITDYCKDGLWLSKVFFYEIRDKPISMIFKVFDPKTIYIIDSNPKPLRLVKRILANPKYSNSVILLVKLPVEEPRGLLDRVYELSKIARKLYLELSPLTFNRELGRLIALKLRHLGEKMEIELCVNKEGVSTSFTHGGLVVNIKSANKCI